MQKLITFGFWENFEQMFDADLVLRLVIAGILGIVIGLEREYRAKEAGFRTHSLVALGSALLMIISQHGYELTATGGISGDWDSSRIAAAVVTGIGFIGAGTIMFQKHVVRGLTTAAGLWVTSAIGLAVGAGMYVIAAVTTVLTLITMEILSLIFKNIGLKSHTVSFYTRDTRYVKQLTDTLIKERFSITSYNVKYIPTTDGEEYEITMTVRNRYSVEEGRLLCILQEFKNIKIKDIE